MLNQLLPYSDVPVEIKNNKNPIPKPRATYSFDFSTNDMSCRFSVGYIIQTEYSTYEYSVNDKVYCEISFDKEQHISTIYKHYRCFNDLVAIMTNRKRNAFDEIHLFPSLDNSCDAFKFSHVYLKENEEAVVDKKPSVSFNDIENGVPILLELIYNSKKDIPSYSIGFIPESSKDFWNVTDDRVRSVFAALECEISINRAVKEHVEDVGLDDLCETVKTCVKAYREEHKGTSSISERTYNLVFNSIKHWSLTAFERIALLFQNYREELAEYHTKWYYDINEEDIQAFVKYRNNITHGKYQNLTQQITDCTKSMQVLVLCSLLDRASVSRDTIKKLCAYGLSD